MPFISTSKKIRSLNLRSRHPFQVFPFNPRSYGLFKPFFCCWTHSWEGPGFEVNHSMTGIRVNECNDNSLAGLNFWTLIFAIQPTILVGLSVVRSELPSRRPLGVRANEHEWQLVHSNDIGRPRLEVVSVLPPGNFEPEFEVLLVLSRFHSIISFSFVNHMLKLF